MGTNRLRGADTDPNIGARRFMRESVVAVAPTRADVAWTLKAAWEGRDPEMPVEMLLALPEEAAAGLELGSRATSLRVVPVPGTPTVDDLCRAAIGEAGGDLVDVVVAGRRSATPAGASWVDRLTALGVDRA